MTKTSPGRNENKTKNGLSKTWVNTHKTLHHIFKLKCEDVLVYHFQF